MFTTITLAGSTLSTFVFKDGALLIISKTIFPLQYHTTTDFKLLILQTAQKLYCCYRWYTSNRTTAYVHWSFGPSHDWIILWVSIGFSLEWTKALGGQSPMYSSTRNGGFHMALKFSWINNVNPTLTPLLNLSMYKVLWIGAIGLRNSYQFIIHIHSNFNFCKYNLLLHHNKRFNWIFPTHFHQFSRLLQGIALTNQVNIKNLLCGNGIKESNVLDRLLKSIPCYCISSSCLLKKYPILELSPHPFKTRVKYSNISLPKGFQSSLYILHLKLHAICKMYLQKMLTPSPKY